MLMTALLLNIFLGMVSLLMLLRFVAGLEQCQKHLQEKARWFVHTLTYPAGGAMTCEI